MNLIIDGDSEEQVLVLAHGAGAPMDSAFMNNMALGIAGSGTKVVRFEFPYMQQRRETGSRRPPNRQADLLACWEVVINQLGGAKHLIIGGKSMGGRMASHIATQMKVRGLVCLGYPFHPQGRADKLRTEHLAGLLAPALFVQGERDALGNCQEVVGYGLPAAIEMCWMKDGDHDFKPRVKSGYSHQHNLDAAINAVVRFINAL